MVDYPIMGGDKLDLCNNRFTQTILHSRREHIISHFSFVRQPLFCAHICSYYSITALYNFYAASEVDEASLHKA